MGQGDPRRQHQSKLTVDRSGTAAFRLDATISRTGVAASQIQLCSNERYGLAETVLAAYVLVTQAADACVEPAPVGDTDDDGDLIWQRRVRQHGRLEGSVSLVWCST